MFEPSGARAESIDCIDMPALPELSPQSPHFLFQKFEALEGIVEAVILQRVQEGAERCDGAPDFSLPWGAMAHPVGYQKLLIINADLRAGTAAAGPMDGSWPIDPGRSRAPGPIVRATLPEVNVI